MRNPHKWDYCLYKRNPRELCYPSAMLRIQQKDAACEPGSGLSADTEFVDSLILDLPASRTMTKILFICYPFVVFCYSCPKSLWQKDWKNLEVHTTKSYIATNGPIRSVMMGAQTERRAVEKASAFLDNTWVILNRLLVKI